MSGSNWIQIGYDYIQIYKKNKKYHLFFIKYHLFLIYQEIVNSNPIINRFETDINELNINQIYACRYPSFIVKF